MMRKRNNKIIILLFFVNFLTIINGYSQSNKHCFIKNIDSAFNISSNTVEYLICSGNFVGISPVKKPCLLDARLNSDSLTIDESLHLLKAFNDTINDWSAQVIMEANSRYGATGSTLVYSNIEVKKWRLQQKWIDLGYWLFNLKLIENHIGAEDSKRYDFVDEIEKRINLLEKLELNNVQKILLFQMREQFFQLKLQYVTHSSNKNKLENFGQLSKVLNGLFLLDTEICENINLESKGSIISAIISNYFINQNKFLYDFDLWEMFYFSYEK